MGSLKNMADLDNNLSSLNKWKKKHGQPKLTQDDLLIKLFDEVTYVRPQMGTPACHTISVQYVTNLALMNELQHKKQRTLDDDR